MYRRFAVIALTAGVIAAMCFRMRGAGTNTDEEAAIRKIIAAHDQKGGGGLEGVPQLADRVVWTGSAKRPMVGDEKEELLSTSSVPNRVPGRTTIKTEPVRIVVANDRDLAYEYGKITTEFDLKSGEHGKLEAGLLRVWQKQDGNWKQAAVFTRPYDAK
jgi:ketosteroid isomerase-like protein